MRPLPCLLALCLTTASVAGQTVPRAVRTEVAGRDATQSAWTRGISQPVEPTLGEAQEIFLLQESLPFFVRSITQPLYSTNAFYDFTERQDWLLQQAIAVGAETIIADHYHVLAEAGSSITRYNEFNQLDRDTLGFRMLADAPLSDATAVGVTYSSTWYFDRGFDHNDSTFHSATLYGSWSIPLPKGGAIQWSPVLTRFWASPDDYDMTSLGLAAALDIPLGAKVSFGLTGRIDRSWYDHYFESLFDGSRRDFALSAGAYAAYRPRTDIEVRVDVNFTNNDSTLNATNLVTGQDVGLYDYDSWMVYPTLQIVFRF